MNKFAVKYYGEFVSVHATLKDAKESAIFLSNHMKNPKRAKIYQAETGYLELTQAGLKSSNSDGLVSLILVGNYTI